MENSNAGGFNFRYYTEEDNIANFGYGGEQLNTVQCNFPRCLLTADQITISTISPDDYIFSSCQGMLGNKFTIDNLVK